MNCVGRKWYLYRNTQGGGGGGGDGGGGGG